MATDWDRRIWRVGRKVGRTIYAQVGPEASDDDVLIGMMDTPEYALDACTHHNNFVGDDTPLRFVGGHVEDVGDV